MSYVSLDNSVNFSLLSLLAWPFFSLPLIFTLVAPSISLFLTAAIKFLCFSFNEIGLLLVFSHALALSLLSRHWNQVQRKSQLLLLKGREAMRFTAETRGCLKCKMSSLLTRNGGRTYGRTLYWQFSQNQNFWDAWNTISYPTVLRWARFVCARAPLLLRARRSGSFSPPTFHFSLGVLLLVWVCILPRGFYISGFNSNLYMSARWVCIFLW